MFERIRALLGWQPEPSEVRHEAGSSVANAEALDYYFFFSEQADAENRC